MDVVDANAIRTSMVDASKLAAAAAANTDSGAQRVLHVALAANEGKLPYIQNKAALIGVSLSDFTSLGVEYLDLADTNFNLKGFNGGFATATHAYYVPYDNGAYSVYAARVSLSDSSSSGVDNDSILKGSIGGFATDTHAYYVPYDNGATRG